MMNELLQALMRGYSGGIEGMPDGPINASLPSGEVTTSDANREALGLMLSSVQAPQPHTTPLPYTTTPEAPRAVNPQFSEQLMRLFLQGAQAPQMNTLGQLLGGR